MANPLSTAIKQGAKTKRQGHRTLLIGGGGVLLLVLYMMHRQSATAAAAVPAATNPTALPAGGGGPGPSTFADNGGQAATLGDSVTNSLSGLQTSIDAQTNAFNGLSGQLATAQSAGTQSTPAASIDPNALASSFASALMALSPGSGAGGGGPTMGSTPGNTPAGRIGQPAAGMRINTQAGNPRQGQSYTTKRVRGGTEHIYASGKRVFVKSR